MGEVIKPIAEILGWRCSKPTPDAGGPGSWFDPKDGHEHGDGPTVDDLLAWLAQFRFASFHFGFAGSYDGFYVDWGRDAAHAPTLLAALEAAVRAVDQSSLASAPPHEVEAPVVAATGDNANRPSL